MSSVSKCGNSLSRLDTVIEAMVKQIINEGLLLWGEPVSPNINVSQQLINKILIGGPGQPGRPCGRFIHPAPLGNVPHGCLAGP